MKQHLNPGGVVTQWVPLYESTPDVVKSELATFFDVFPDGTIWGNDINGSGYDVVLAGHAAPQPIDVDSLSTRGSRGPSTRASRDRSPTSGSSSGLSLLLDLRGRGARSGAVARRGADQPRLEPAAAVSRGFRAQHVPELRHLLADASLSKIPGRPLRRRRHRARAVADADRGSARGAVSEAALVAHHARAFAANGAWRAYVRRRGRRSTERWRCASISSIRTRCAAAAPASSRSRPARIWPTACSSRTRPSWPTRSR